MQLHSTLDVFIYKK